MDTSFLFKGLLIGFSIAAPVGPIGVLCIRRTLAQGRLTGLLSGLGAATADALYGCVAGFGLTFVSTFLLDQQLWFKLVGSLFLLYLGLKTFLARPVGEAAPAQSKDFLGAYLSTFVLTLTNPATILSFMAVFAGLGLASAGSDYSAAAILVLGVFIGSALWWFLLSGGVGLFRAVFDARRLRWVNYLSGIIITGFGVGVLVSLVA
jgi:threonine/homoserine/homoserine lactone efflux protein